MGSQTKFFGRDSELLRQAYQLGEDKSFAESDILSELVRHYRRPIGMDGGLGFDPMTITTATGAPGAAPGGGGGPPAPRIISGEQPHPNVSFSDVVPHMQQPGTPWHPPANRPQRVPANNYPGPNGRPTTGVPQRAPAAGAPAAPGGAPGGGVPMGSSGDFIKRQEGLRLSQYNDAGHRAIGYGHDLTPQELRQGFVQTAQGNIPINRITRDQAEALFQHDYQSRVQQVNKMAPGFTNLNSNQQEAVMSYYYNTGRLPQNFAQNLQNGNHQAISDSLRNGINTVHGVPNSALTGRRSQEASLYSQPAAPQSQVAGGQQPPARSQSPTQTGQNQPAPQTGSAYVYPVTGRLTGAYGDARPAYTGHSGPVSSHVHAGNDFAAPLGSPVGAVADGKVISSQYHKGYGNTVDVLHADGTFTRYAHLANPSVKAGQSITAGQQLGQIGPEGHVHFEAHTHYDYKNPQNNYGRTTTIDPQQYLAMNRNNPMVAGQPINPQVAQRQQQQNQQQASNDNRPTNQAQQQAQAQAQQDRDAAEHDRAMTQSAARALGPAAAHMAPPGNSFTLASAGTPPIPNTAAAQNDASQAAARPIPPPTPNTAKPMPIPTAPQTARPTPIPAAPVAPPVQQPPSSPPSPPPQQASVSPPQQASSPPPSPPPQQQQASNDDEKEDEMQAAGALPHMKPGSIRLAETRQRVMIGLLRPSK